MAEAVVGLLIDKLGKALLNEAAPYAASRFCMETSALKGLFGEIHRAVGWLQIMKAYLQDSEKFKNTNNITDAFVKRIRELAFRMEDVVDEFKYKLEEQKQGGFAGKIKKRIQHVKVWHRLAIELRNINADLEDAAKQRNLPEMERYGGGMERYGGGNDNHTGSNNPALSFWREEDLVGVKDNAEKLKEWLLDSLKEKKSRIITVWGMGGTGKTTLVDHVYKTVKEDFDYAARLTVSNNYQVEDLLKKIARDCGIPDDASNMDLQSLVEVIRNHLRGKTFIMVLDDVWKKDVWLKIMDVFPSNCICRFILTSRKLEVASLATDNCCIRQEPLEHDLSLELFCNVAFRNIEDKRCPPELQGLATKFLQRCEGLPLAIACIGRLLCCKPPTYSAWKNIYDELELQSSKHVIPGVDSILGVSLVDLSYELKNCFLHCAMFPEDYEIKRRRLIRHWISSGFIKEKGNNTLEEVAEDYLNELVNRSLLQVTEKNSFGRVKCFRIHDIIRHLALDKAEEESFGKVYEGTTGFSTASLRRLSIQSANISILSHSDAMHIRAIYAFTKNLDGDLLRPILASSNLLSILDLQGTEIKVLPDEIFSLYNLRFLGIRHTGIEILPETIKRLQNLEVLDGYDTALVSLPKGVAKLKKLQYLYAGRFVRLGNCKYFYGVKVPRGIGNLTGLHALQKVKASMETLCDVAALTELRTFSVSNVTSEHSSNLCTAISNMNHLVHLSIATSDRTEILPLEALHLPETLYKLHLHGQLERKWILSSWSHLSNLVVLDLTWSKLDDHLFSKLLMLHSLCELSMTEAYDGNELRFPVHSFPKLRELGILGAPQLNHVEIEEGALESLVVFKLAYCPELKCLPGGIEYLTALEELYLLDTSEELIEKLRQKCEADECIQELMKISHIRKVFVALSEKNIWEWIR